MAPGVAVGGLPATIQGTHQMNYFQEDSPYLWLHPSQTRQEEVQIGLSSTKVHADTHVHCDVYSFRPRQS